MSRADSKHAWYINNREACLERSKRQKENYIPKHNRDITSRLKYLCTKAKKRKWEIDFDHSYLLEVWNKQNGSCAYTGLPLLLKANHPESVSLDRIDSQIGYLKGNVQLICFVVNKMKQEFSEDQFFYYCSLITNNKMKNTQE